MGKLIDRLLYNVMNNIVTVDIVMSFLELFLTAYFNISRLQKVEKFISVGIILYVLNINSFVAITSIIIISLFLKHICCGFFIPLTRYLITFLSFLQTARPSLLLMWSLYSWCFSCTEYSIPVFIRLAPSCHSDLN